MPSSENDPSAPQSSLKIDSILHLIEQPPARAAPAATRKGPLPVVQRFQLRSSKFREGMSQFLTTQKDSSSLNVFVDVMMVVFGLGATAAILAGVIYLIRIFAGTG
ncbi:MAG TPA: hypothetical protein VKK79_00930 [Candidatus Lokiarchaeia archaeon]|nr:hypothetical protein [Candidatus Lokiarchaeia archaeon]